MNSNHNICPLCDEGVLVSASRIESVHVADGHSTDIMFHYSVCRHCGQDITTPKQAKENELRVKDARRAFLNLLPSDRIRDIRKKFSLSQTDASHIFGGGANAFSKYERGAVIQSVAMDRLLRVTDEYPFIFYKLVEYASNKTILSRSTRFITDYMLSNDGCMNLAGFKLAAPARCTQKASANQEENKWTTDPCERRLAANG